LIRILLGSIPDFPRISGKNFLNDFATRGRGSPSEGSEGLRINPGIVVDIQNVLEVPNIWKPEYSVQIKNHPGIFGMVRNLG
jgi:hypothetical protein